LSQEWPDEGQFWDILYISEYVKPGISNFIHALTMEINTY